MKLGIIGCGNMGSALAKGILSKRVLQFNNIYVSDKDAAKTRALHRKFGIIISGNEELAKKCNVVIVAVKPKDSDKLLESISGLLDTRKMSGHPEKSPPKTPRLQRDPANRFPS